MWQAQEHKLKKFRYDQNQPPPQKKTPKQTNPQIQQF